MVARRAHNPEVAGSSPVPATMLKATFKLILNVAFIFTLYSVSPML